MGPTASGCISGAFSTGDVTRVVSSIINPPLREITLGAQWVSLGPQWEPQSCQEKQYFPEPAPRASLIYPLTVGALFLKRNNCPPRPAVFPLFLRCQEKQFCKKRRGALLAAWPWLVIRSGDLRRGRSRPDLLPKQLVRGLRLAMAPRPASPPRRGTQASGVPWRSSQSRPCSPSTSTRSSRTSS